MDDYYMPRINSANKLFETDLNAILNGINIDRMDETEILINRFDRLRKEYNANLSRLRAIYSPKFEQILSRLSELKEEEE